MRVGNMRIPDVRIKFVDYSNLQVLTNTSILRELRNLLSFEVPGARFQPRVRDGFWDGIIRLIDVNGVVGIGTLNYIVSWCKDMGYSCEVDPILTERNNIKREEFDTWLSGLDIKAGGNSITPYWYQADSVFHGIKNKLALLNLPTSAGKSLIAGLLLRFFFDFIAKENETGLLIVPSTGLVSQMLGDLLDYGLFERDDILCIGGSFTTSVAKDIATSYKISYVDGSTETVKSDQKILVDGKENVGKTFSRRKNLPETVNGRQIKSIKKVVKHPRIIISTWQSAVSFKANVMDNVGMLINDEAHLADGKSITKIITLARNAEYKFGLSGSLKDAIANEFQYLALFGPTFKPTSTKELMDEGQVSNLKIRCVFIKYPENVCKIAQKTKLKYHDEIKFITAHEERNEIVSKLAGGLSKSDENVFLMFRNLAHGKMLYERVKQLSEDDSKVFYIAGDVDGDVRDQIKKFTENNTGVIVIASYGVFSTGISVKNLHHIIFGHPVKSKITVLQSIGRVLRLHGSKDTATVWDIIDDMGVEPTRQLKSKKKYSWTNFGIAHGLERINRYIEERFEYSINEVKLK